VIDTGLVFGLVSSKRSTGALNGAMRSRRSMIPSNGVA